MPVSSTIDYIKRRSSGGRRFKMITISDNEGRAYYAYRDTLFNRMGYSVTYASELKITNDPSNASKTIIEFKVPRLRMILYALIGVFIVGFFSFAYPDTSLLWQGIILVTLYLGIVVELNSQLSYLQSDIEQIEENFKRQTDS
jgi:hypothetical protein